MFNIVEGKNGKSVVSNKIYYVGDSVMNFKGEILSGDDLPSPYESVEDHYVQIGENLYMGPSREADDFVNHSCDPNCRLVIEGDIVFLEAIRDIKIEEEITWDYSTFIDEMTRAEDLKGWTLKCTCGSPKCRGEVGDFRFLDKEVIKTYLDQKMFPEYVVRKIHLEQLV